MLVYSHQWSKREYITTSALAQPEVYRRPGESKSRALLVVMNAQADALVKIHRRAMHNKLQTNESTT